MVVDGEVFVRSRNDKLAGWFRAFREAAEWDDSTPGLEILVRAKPARGARIRDAVTAASGEKYNTKASWKWVGGFAESARALTTLGFVPH